MVTVYTNYTGAAVHGAYYDANDPSKSGYSNAGHTPSTPATAQSTYTAPTHAPVMSTPEPLPPPPEGAFELKPGQINLPSTGRNDNALFINQNRYDDLASRARRNDSTPLEFYGLNNVLYRVTAFAHPRGTYVNIARADGQPI